MKQGRASRDVSESSKVEPTPHVVTPARANQYGEAVSFIKEPMYAGRGFSAPKDAARQVHRGGSQGKH